MKDVIDLAKAGMNIDGGIKDSVGGDDKSDADIKDLIDDVEEIDDDVRYVPEESSIEKDPYNKIEMKPEMGIGDVENILGMYGQLFFLKGGKRYEEVEENPMLGYRGASRYVAEPDIFDLEIEAIKRVREEHKNLWVMIPFVRTVDGMKRIKEHLEFRGLNSSDDFKLWMMVEVPANIFLIEKFIEVGLDGISIGTNDLTQLILGIDRDSSKLEYLFDERNEAVLIALERAIKAAESMGVTSSICGQAPSVYPELTEKLVEWGITSVSVTPDMIGTTREIVAKAEARLNIK